MSALDAQQLTLILATIIKQYGKNNVLKMIDTEIDVPMSVRLHPTGDDVILVLLEGQDNIDKWDGAAKCETPADEPMRSMLEREPGA